MRVLPAKLEARLVANDIADGLEEADVWSWLYCECSMCLECFDEWDEVPDEWQWVRREREKAVPPPRRWIWPTERAA